MSFMSVTPAWTLDKPAPKASVLRRLFGAVAYEIRMRRAIRHVNSLDDRTLVDIGLLQGSVEDAVRRGRRR
ncbi:DUF1127 domain-containing protein [Microvirga brassicacearum]|nr:DUF1127 domain-containing protein [Microvirga brassicacearum]